MTQGEDAMFIEKIFKEKVVKFDPLTTYTDLFFFNGALHNMSLGLLLPWKQACVVTNFRPYNVSELNFVFPFYCTSKLLSYSHPQNMPVVTCVWVMCKSQDPFTIHDRGISTDEWKNDWITQPGFMPCIVF